MKKNRRMNRYLRKTVSCVIAACMILPMPVSHAEESLPIIIDEAAYVTLDYDGSIENVSVVKTCQLNSNDCFDDYGDYEKVNNMTTMDTAQINNGKITWNLQNQKTDEKFYYEVKPKNNKIDMPWNMKVSYALNGQPIEGSKLAGESGLVAIDVKVTPNEKCNEYYQNNFILMSAMMVDTEKVTSFCAPGAQFQSLGTYQMAVNMVTPKKEEEFRYEIGSEEFETMGVMFFMAPITMSQMDDIAEVNEHKENIEDASSAMNQVMDDMLSMMSSMSTGMSQTADGLDQLDAGSQVISNYNDLGDASIQQMLDSLASMQASLNEFSDIIGNTQMVSHLAGMGSDLKDGLAEMGKMTDHMRNVTGTLENVQGLLGQMQDADEAQKQALTEEVKVENEELTEAVKGMKEDVSPEAIADTMENVQEIISEVEVIKEETDDGATQTASAEVNILSSAAETMAGTIGAAGSELEKSINNMGEMIEQIDDMSDGMMLLTEDLGPILRETKIVMADASATIKAMSDMVYVMDSMLDQAGPYLEQGSHLTLNGMSQLMREMVVTLKKTEEIKANKDIIADVIEDEWNRLDDDLQILDIDPSAKKISFTSDKNIEPRSLQMIVKTKSIEIDDALENSDIKSSSEDIGVIGRVKLIFVKIGEFLLSIFS
ncbi:MAG: methyl-accepting chemotaxis protein [Lachnospiraceae bacterium]|nr:methyl-accepting chemotaxis protein [Lachnospiraceae bacterium]